MYINIHIIRYYERSKNSRKTLVLEPLNGVYKNIKKFVYLAFCFTDINFKILADKMESKSSLKAT